MSAAEFTQFLTSLAVQDKVAASTQNQALSALLFLYREVLGVDLPWFGMSCGPSAPAPAGGPTRDETRGSSSG
jgi:Phage integrase, N-terminal SAM-like domain